MDQPGMLGSGVSNDGDLMRMIQGLQRQINELKAANPLATMGITPQMGGIAFGGNVEIDGTGTVNGPLNVNGAMAVTGTLSLPAGIINNDALSNPVQFGSVGPTEGSFAVDTTHRKRAVTTMTIPAGYSQATILTVANVDANNTTANTDHLYVQAYAGAGVGSSSITSVLPTDVTSASASAINSFTGLSGGTIEVGCYVYCSTGPWTASSYNLASVNAIVWFTR